VSLLSKLTGEKIGARWQTIWTTTSLQLSGANLNRPKPVANCQFFLDGTIIRLVTTISSIIAQDSEEKFGLVVAKQAAFLSKVCTGTSWEFSQNIHLDYIPKDSETSPMEAINHQIPWQTCFSCG
jgi:hypothetical protein